MVQEKLRWQLWSRSQKRQSECGRGAWQPQQQRSSPLLLQLPDHTRCVTKSKTYERDVLYLTKQLNKLESDLIKAVSQKPTRDHASGLVPNEGLAQDLAGKVPGFCCQTRAGVVHP